MQTLTSPDDVFDSESHCWSHLQVFSSNKPSARVGHSLIYSPSEKCLICIGGACPEGLSQSLYKLDLDSFIWKEVPSVNFKFRYEHCAFVSEIKDRICPFVFGGADTSGNRNDLQMWDSDSQQWKNIESKGEVPSPRTQHSCAVLNGLLYVFSGGAIGTEPVSDRSVFVFDPQKSLWICIETIGSSPCARQGHCMIAIENQVYVHGGMNGEDFYDDMYVLNTKEKSWCQIDPVGSRPSPRAAHGAVSVERNFYIFGGLGRDGALNDFFRFDTVHGFWQKLEFGEELPSPRLDFAMCSVKLDAPHEIPNQSQSLNPISKSGTKEDELPLCCKIRGRENSATRTVIFLHGGMDTSGNIFDDTYIYFV